jgi:hypothetical protein
VLSVASFFRANVLGFISTTIVTSEMRFALVILSVWALSFGIAQGTTNFMQFTYLGNSSSCPPSIDKLLDGSFMRANMLLSGMYADCTNPNYATVYSGCASTNVSDCITNQRYNDRSCAVDPSGNTVYSLCLDDLYYSLPPVSVYRYLRWAPGMNESCPIPNEASFTDMRVMGRCDGQGRYFTCDSSKRYRWTCTANDCSSGCTQDNTYDLVNDCVGTSESNPQRELCNIVYAPGAAPPKAAPVAAAAPTAKSSPTAAGPVTKGSASSLAFGFVVMGAGLLAALLV